MIENIKRFLALVEMAIKIRDSKADWDTKFHLIFPGISRPVNDFDFGVKWNDPDTSYEDDVRAYIGAIERKATELRIVLDALVVVNRTEAT